jgi:hypothetical protein
VNTFSPRNSIVHYAKVDRWLAALLGGLALAEVTAGVALVVTNLITDSPDPTALGVGAVLVGVGVLIGLALWGCYRIRYEITPSALIVHCGPLRTTVPLEAIVEVFPTHNPLSAPAPSLDRLEIKYRKKTGGTAFTLISPKDKEAFARDLASAAPQLRQVEDGPARLKAQQPA